MTDLTHLPMAADGTIDLAELTGAPTEAAEESDFGIDAALIWAQVEELITESAGKDLAQMATAIDARRTVVAAIGGLDTHARIMALMLAATVIALRDG